jgi:4-amino-4-deoxy-L-arabinose transferase-like glycosyltransferase
MDDKKFNAAVISTVFILSFSVRFIFLDETITSSMFLINTLRGTDMEGYLAWAVKITRGIYDPNKPFWQAPLYPYFLSVIFRLTGGNVYAAYLVQILLSSLTCVFIYLASKEAFNKITAAAAGFISCFYGPFIFYSSIMLSETLGIFLISASIYSLCRFLTVKKITLLAAGGALLGAASLARPNFLLFALFYLVYLYKITKNIKTYKTYLLVFSLTLLAIILPVTLRNYIVSGEFVLISANFLETFRLSNSFDSLILNYTEPRLPLMPLTSGAFWIHQFKKAVFFWWGFEVPQNVNYYLFAEKSAVLKLPLFPFWLLAPFSLAGIFLLKENRLRNSSSAVLLIYIISYYVSIIMFYIASRLRLPVMAGLIPLSAFGIIKTFAIIKNKKFGKASLILFFCAVFACLSFPKAHPKIRGTDYRMLGIAMAKEGLYKESLGPLKKSLPQLPPNEREKTKELITRIESILSD